MDREPEVQEQGFFEEKQTASEQRSAVRSVVQVHFPDRNMTLAYYNDRFDLQVGDVVFVEGKLEGLRGHVTEVARNFKIRISDYKRVISVADRSICGTFQMAGSHLVTFSPSVLPYAKAVTWFKAPKKPEDEYAAGQDDSFFDLEDLAGLHVSEAIAQRGSEYYRENRVCYLSLDGTHGQAVVEGSRPYEVEFRYRDGRISGLVCECYCSQACKHELAVMLQLRETLALIREAWPDRFQADGYFAAVSKQAFFSFAVANRKKGELTIGV